MHDERLLKLADLLVNYSVSVKPGDRVAIQASTAASPLIQAVFASVLQAGGHPYLMTSLPELEPLLYKHASKEQLQYIPEPARHVFENYEVMISLIAENNTRALNNVAPEKVVLREKAHEELRGTFLQRAARGELRWTLTLFPTEAHAQDAEMSLAEYEDFVFNACMPDMNDPVAYWKNFSTKQEKIITWLKGKENIHVIGPETDLRLSVKGRTFINCDCHVNVPDGEIFTGPVEQSVEGHVYFSYPAIYRGREVNGVRLWFEGGKVIKATAEKNEDFLVKTLDTDEGARFVGEFAIGTNEGIRQFSKEILFDEKIAGSFHMALGAGYPETGSVNKSAIHWDMICDLYRGGEIWADGECFYRDGQFHLEL
ncbi:MAG: aminopeptidase [Anaerolineaceae bacterium]|nr:aminopeptidase [Anaerolineaceae bacterium]